MGEEGGGSSWQNYLASSALVFACVCSVSLVLLALASSATAVGDDDEVMLNVLRCQLTY